MVGSPLALQMVSALMRAFSSKVVPVSSGSMVIPSSFWLTTSWPCASRMRRSSRSFPALPVAAQIFMWLLPFYVSNCLTLAAGRSIFPEKKNLPDLPRAPLSGELARSA